MVVLGGKKEADTVADGLYRKRVWEGERWAEQLLKAVRTVDPGRSIFDGPLKSPWSPGTTTIKYLAEAEERQLSHNSLIAYRRTWLKIIAWAAAEGLVLETFPVERVGNSMRRRHAAEAPRITSRSKLRLPSSITSSVHQIPLPSALRQGSPPRKPNCATIPLRRSGNSCTNCVKIAAATLAT